MIIQPIPVPTEREPTWQEEMNIASMKAFDDEPRREAFRSGAKWATPEASDCRYFRYKISLMFLLLIQLILFLLGAFEGPKYNSNFYRKEKYFYTMPGKWKFITPGYTLGTYFNKFMSEE